MNVFDLKEWKKKDITGIYHRWQNMVGFLSNTVLDPVFMNKYCANLFEDTFVSNCATSKIIIY